MTARERRWKKNEPELDELYQSLYDDPEKLAELKQIMRTAESQRSPALRRLDGRREKDPNWYQTGKMLGMTMYTDLFAGSIQNLGRKLEYLANQGITYLHLMPLLKMPHPDNDGGYAVEDFTQVDPSLGTNEDLILLASAMRRRGMSLCLDFVINHTSDTHEWAKRAKSGQKEYMDRYICYETEDIPREFERTVPDVFPTTAPGSFIWVKEMKRWVCSSFYPFQWDLNYRNPAVFNGMMEYMLQLTNMGVEVLRIDATPYLWKELGTTCRNLPQVHTIMRMIRLITDTICPGVLLKGEVVMAPKELAPYFGSQEKPECHLLYNSSTMCTQWSALATGDIRQLKRQLDDLHSLPLHCHFVNYIRCHDDIGWGLNEEYGSTLGQDPLQHKIYLYNFYSGNFPGSWAKGELYNYDPVSKDARTCGTTASLCGIEKGLEDHDENEVTLGIQRDLLMHATIMAMKGFPMLSSGDEIAQLNGYDYHDDPDRREDSRNVHRSKFNWENAELRKQPNTLQERVWDGLAKIEDIRRTEYCFSPESSVSTWDTHTNAVLAIVRRCGPETMACLFNYSGKDQPVTMDAMEGTFTDLISGNSVTPSHLTMAPWQYMFCRKKD